MHTWELESVTENNQNVDKISVWKELLFLNKEAKNSDYGMITDD